MATDIVGRGWAFRFQSGPRLVGPHIGPLGGLALTNRNSELEQSILIILHTAPGERVMRPTFGCRIHELVFAPNDNHTAAQARRYVEEALGMWEPRINVRQVKVRPDREDASRMLIDIEYEVKATHDRRSLVHPFYLIPEESG